MPPPTYRRELLLSSCFGMKCKAHFQKWISEMLILIF